MFMRRMVDGIGRKEKGETYFLYHSPHTSISFCYILDLTFNFWFCCDYALFASVRKVNWTEMRLV